MARVPALPDPTSNSLHEIMNLKIVRTGTATISSGTALSDAVTLLGMSPVRLTVGAKWKGKASIAFRVSEDNVTYTDLYNGAAPYALVAGTSKSVVVDPLKLDGVQYMKLRAVLATTGLTGLAQDKNATVTVAYKLL